MRATRAALPFLIVFLLSGSGALAQDVYVNGQVVSADEIRALQELMGIPEAAPIPAGSYWYDPAAGLWGMEGGPTVGQIFPGLELGGELREDASGGGTMVFINGRELHPQEVMYLQQLFGVVYPGRYWLDWQGNGGYEGGPAIFNLVIAAQAAGVGGGGGGYGGYTRRTPFGSVGGDGNCSYYLDPSGASVMNCN